MASVVGAICHGLILRTSDTQFIQYANIGSYMYTTSKVPHSVFNAIGRTGRPGNVSPTRHAVADLGSQPNII